jgi:hypothetical protein
MPSTDAPEDDKEGGLAGTLLIVALVVLFAVAIIALIYLAVAD